VKEQFSSYQEMNIYLGEEDMKKLVTVSLIVSSAILLIVSCGGGGGGGGGTVELCLQEWDHWLADTLNPPTSSNLVDTYDLTGFDIDVWEEGSFLGSLDETDFSSYSGTMDIQPTTITQTLTLEGDSDTITGSYTVSPAGSTAGTLHITDVSGTHDVDFDINGNTLTTDSGLFCVDVPADAMGIESLETGVVDSIGSLLGGMFRY
jgi:hypothetical protein